MATTRTVPPVAREMFLINEQRRGFDTIGGEGGGGAGGRVGNDESEVGAAALLEAGLGGAETKSAGNDELGKVAHEMC